MRTNIVLNDILLKEAQQYSYAQTKRALVEEALQLFVQVKAEQEKTQTYRDRLKKLEPHLNNLHLRESPQHLLRYDREHR